MFKKKTQLEKTWTSTEMSTTPVPAPKVDAKLRVGCDVVSKTIFITFINERGVETTAEFPLDVAKTFAQAISSITSSLNDDSQTKDSDHAI